MSRLTYFLCLIVHMLVNFFMKQFGLFFFLLVPVAAIFLF